MASQQLPEWKIVHIVICSSGIEDIVAGQLTTAKPNESKSFLKFSIAVPCVQTKVVLETTQRYSN